MDCPVLFVITEFDCIQWNWQLLQKGITSSRRVDLLFSEKSLLPLSFNLVIFVTLALARDDCLGFILHRNYVNHMVQLNRNGLLKMSLSLKFSLKSEFNFELEYEIVPSHHHSFLLLYFFQKQRMITLSQQHFKLKI
jgi:hypothetical protein